MSYITFFEKIHFSNLLTNEKQNCSSSNIDIPVFLWLNNRVVEITETELHHIERFMRRV